MEKIKKFEREIIFALVLGLVVSSLVAFWGDVSETLSELLSFNWRLVPVILLLTCFNYFLRFVRWHYFLTKVGFKANLELKKSGLVFLSGLPLTLTPGKTGEVLKAYFLKRITGDHLSRTIPVVVTERLTDGLAAVILLSFSLFLYPFGRWATIFAFFSCALFIVFIYHQPFWRLVEKGLSKLKNYHRFFGQLVPKLASFREVFLQLVSWRSLAAATLLAAVAWLAEAVGFAVIIADITNQTLTLEIMSQALFIFCFVSILGFVSFLPGGLGVAEGGFVGLLILLVSLGRSQAAAVTILLRLLTLWWGVGIGLVAFFTMLGKFRKDDR